MCGIPRIFYTGLCPFHEWVQWWLVSVWKMQERYLGIWGNWHMKPFKSEQKFYLLNIILRSYRHLKTSFLYTKPLWDLIFSAKYLLFLLWKFICLQCGVKELNELSNKLLKIYHSMFTLYLNLGKGQVFCEDSEGSHIVRTSETIERLCNSCATKSLRYIGIFAMCS